MKAYQIIVKHHADPNLEETRDIIKRNRGQVWNWALAHFISTRTEVLTGSEEIIIKPVEVEDEKPEEPENELDQNPS